MISAYTVFGLGIACSLFNICLWVPIIRAQLKQYHSVKMNMQIKNILLVFSLTSLASNFMPVWFDVYRIVHQTQPTNLFYAYVISSYTYRTCTAVMFYLIYKM